MTHALPPTAAAFLCILAVLAAMPARAETQALPVTRNHQTAPVPRDAPHAYSLPRATQRDVRATRQSLSGHHSPAWVRRQRADIHRERGHYLHALQ